MFTAFSEKKICHRFTHDNCSSTPEFNLQAVEDNLNQHMQVKRTTKLYFGLAFQNIFWLRERDQPENSVCISFMLLNLLFLLVFQT